MNNKRVSMPELPEVETVKNGLIPYMKNQTIKYVEQRRENLRYPFPIDFANRLEGSQIIDIKRRAKYLLIEITGDLIWMVHLGMSGKFTIIKPELVKANDNYNHDNSKIGHNSEYYMPEKHDHLIVELDNGALAVYNDPRRFGFMDLFPKDKLDSNKHLKNMGPDATSDEFNGKYIQKIMQNRKSPIKTALLNQKLIAGLGNIYVCEALWQANISPLCKANDISNKKLSKLVPIIKDILTKAIAAGGSSLKDFVNAEGDLGYFQNSWAVYNQEGKKCCKDGCGGTITRINQGGRSSFYCTSHQK